MKNLYNFLASIIIISGCSNVLDDNFEGSTLISPKYTFSNYLIQCTLKENENLLSLESFLSSLIKDQSYKNNKFLLRAYFPKSESVNKFILNIQNNSNEDMYPFFINDISLKGFDKVASCNFNTNVMQTALLIDSNLKNTEALSYISEILSCDYNEGYNYGTFKIAIDRFSNQISSLKLPYQALYLQDEISANSFVWINNFYTDDYSKEITNLWINTIEAKEIKDEFLMNAQCIESNVYNSFAIN